MTAIATQTAHANEGLQARHYDWKHLSLTERIAVQKKMINEDWRIVTRWRSRQVAILKKQRKLQTAQPPTWRAISALLPAEPYKVWWHYRHMKWTQRELDDSKAALRKLQAAPTGYPPHHALWVCIGSFEGSPTSDNGHGHYGLLQMHENWYSLKGKANAYPQSVQEWAAENAWKANGYSYSFLYDQWFAYDNADGCYTG